MSNEKHHISHPGTPGTHHVGVADQELRIDRLATGGRGIARHEGQVWFVAGGVPGDRLLARKVRQHSRFVEARFVRILEPSPVGAQVIALGLEV